MTTNFESHKCLIFLQSTKIGTGTHENKAIHSMWSLEVFKQMPLYMCCDEAEQIYVPTNTFTAISP